MKRQKMLSKLSDMGITVATLANGASNATLQTLLDKAKGEREFSARLARPLPKFRALHAHD